MGYTIQFHFIAEGMSTYKVVIVRDADGCHAKRWDCQACTDDRQNEECYYLWSKITHTWWRHQMETFSALLAICAGNSPVTGEYPA